jgi:cytochrome c-type biogenesis protein CcmH/NrfF
MLLLLSASVLHFSSVGLSATFYAPAFGPAALSAQIPHGVEGPFAPHREAEKAISRLLSPFCPGLMLEVCPSPPAAALRDSIQLLAAEGMNADELVSWMLANHGERYRAIPERSGAGLWAWVMPPFALLLGLALVVVLLRRFRRPPAAGGAAGTGRSISAEERDRIEAALREMDFNEGPS